MLAESRSAKIGNMMILALAKRIRNVWIQNVCRALARGTDIRQTFEAQLRRFYDLLEQTLESGDPVRMDPILLDWTNSPTLSQLERGENDVSHLLYQMMVTSIDTARENLSESEALDLISAMAPVYVHSLQKVARLETDTRIAHVTDELVDTQQKLEKLDRTKSNFISVAAHELKTPLTLIEGYTSMMRDAATQTDASSIDPLLHGVSTGIRRLHRIVDDMIDVSLIDSHLLSLNLQPIKIGYLIGLLESELIETLRQRKLTLKVHEFTESEQWIYADNERIHQALRNVLSNAIKFTPDKGMITIRGRSLPGFIEVVVTDTGIGISPEDQSTIFEKFGQLGRVDLHSSGRTKFKGGGPGLGLSITRGIIEAHGGTIWVESEGYDEAKCPGSTFHILLPNRTEASDTRIAKLLNHQKETHAEENPHTDQTAT
jgi:signal transduction histidine kinase